jgi:hypothetical protein
MANTEDEVISLDIDAKKRRFKFSLSVGKYRKILSIIGAVSSLIFWFFPNLNQAKNKPENQNVRVKNPDVRVENPVK